jgi:hypothetical protein
MAKTYRNVSWFTKTVAVSSNGSVAKQLNGLLRGQWVLINGMMARIVNVTDNAAVLWMHADKMPSIWR